MTYEEMCRYVAAREGFTDWGEFVASANKRDAALTHTRQVCFYLGYEIFKELTLSKLGKIFKKDHATVLHSVRTIGFDRKNSRALDTKLTAYMGDIKAITQNDVPQTREAVDYILESMIPTIEKMRVIAEAYCNITGRRLV